jgi:hypothetical protein
VRLFNRRFTRLTLGYSKKLANLKYSVALFIAHYNFCRVHSAHKQTPAMAAELTNHVWTIEELFLSTLSKVGRDRSTGYRWVSLGMIAPINIMGRLYITTEEIARF